MGVPAPVTPNPNPRLDPGPCEREGTTTAIVLANWVVLALPLVLALALVLALVLAVVLVLLAPPNPYVCC